MSGGVPSPGWVEFGVSEGDVMLAFAFIDSLRVFPETAETGDARCGIRVGAGEDICATSALHAGKTHLDDGWRRAGTP